jgi:hypothetical protein
MKLLVAVPFLTYPIGSASFPQKSCGETARSERCPKAAAKS